MAKVTGPLFSLDARGSIGKSITYSIWKGLNYVRRLVVPENPNTDDQVVVRTIMTDGSQKWSDGTITASDKLLWNAFAEGKAFSGFNAYMKAYYTANVVVGPPMSVLSPQEIPTAPAA
jgi:hypothetical protein